MSAPGLGDPQEWRRSYEHPRAAREAHCEVPTTGRSRHLADDGRHVTDPAARFAGVFVGIVNAAPVVVFSVAQHPPHAYLVVVRAEVLLDDQPGGLEGVA